VNSFSGKITGVGNENANGNFNGAVIYSMLKPFDNTRKKEADRNPGTSEKSKAQETRVQGWNLAIHNHRSGKFQSEQTGCVVYQAFAFEHV
jgi:hypothetical protein